MRQLNEIIVHCAATHADWRKGAPTSEKVAEIRRWHVQDNGWKDIGYHAVIDRDGTVAPGRADDVVGAHCSGRNANSLGVCLLGGHGSNANDAFEQHYTPEQDRALRRWIDQKRAQYPGIRKVSGHNEYAAKACPGFNVARWLAHKAPTPSKTETLADTLRTKEGLAVVAGPVAGAMATAATGEGPVQYAIAAVLVIAALAGAFYILRRRA